MGEAFLTRRGGGAASGGVKGAVIGVIFPEGATVSVSNGTKTYTAKDTDGNTAFSVEAGTWTVTAALGEDSDEKEVTVREGDFVTVELKFFSGLVYDNGKDYVGLEYVNVEGSGISLSKESDHLLMTKLSSGGQSAGFMCALIDISEYSKLTATFVPANTGTHPFYIAVHSTNSPSYATGPDGSAQMMQNTTKESDTAELDISGFSGEYYVGIYGKSYGGIEVISRCLKIEMA